VCDGSESSYLSNRSSSTLFAFRENKEKFVPEGKTVAPSGEGSPDDVFRGSLTVAVYQKFLSTENMEITELIFSRAFRVSRAFPLNFVETRGAFHFRKKNFGWKNNHECTSSPLFTFDSQIATHHFTETAADGKTETGSSILASC